MGTTTRHLLILGCVGALVLFLNLGAPPLWDRDEPRNAACAREMMERGDWIVPTFNGELRVLKPVMKYWFMMVGYQLFGVNEFAARFFSAVFALICAVATYWLGKRLFGPTAGLWAGLILLTNLLFVMSGHLAKIDAALTFFSLLSLLIYAAATFPKPDQTETTSTAESGASLLTRSWGVWVLFYAAIGLAVLAKGLPGAVPAAVLGMFLLIVTLPTAETAPTTWLGRGLSLLRPFAPLHFLSVFWRMRPLTGLIVVLAVAGPWYVLVGLKTDGEFLRGFFLDHHLGRAMEPLERHSGPFLVYYAVTILLGLFPWSVFTVVLLPWLMQQLGSSRPTRYACLLLSCWVGVYVVLFSCAQTKLPSYITPCFPALALLLGALLADLSARVSVPTGPVRLALISLGLIGILMVGALIAATYFIPIEGVYSSLGLVLVLGSVAALRYWQQNLPAAAMNVVGVTATVFTALVFGVLLPRVGSLQQQEQVCERLFRNSKTGELGYFSTMEPSWVFYAGQPIKPIALPDSPLGPTNRWKVAPTTVHEFLRQGEHPYIITTDKDFPYLRPCLPADVTVVSEIPKFLRKGNWLVVGRPQPGTQARANPAATPNETEFPEAAK